MKNEKPVTQYEMSNCCDDFEWDDAKENFLQGLKQLERKTKTGYRVEGHNLGWRHLSGYFLADDAKECMKRLFELNTDWNMTVKEYKTRIEITRYHHDAPTGEFLTIRSVKNGN